jgi:hypothetical protein
MRSKAEVLQEFFGVKTLEEADRLYGEPDVDTRLPLSSYTKLTLPYEAPNHPGIPTWAEVQQALAESKIGSRYDRHSVCRIGDTVVKVGCDASMVQVGIYALTCMATHD